MNNKQSLMNSFSNKFSKLNLIMNNKILNNNNI